MNSTVQQFKTQFRENIFHHVKGGTFEEKAIALFRFQAKHCKVYNAFISNLGIEPDQVHSIDDIPCMPVELFKQHKVYTGTWQEPELIFRSSGTTGGARSTHYIFDASLYEESIIKGFERFAGPLENYVVLTVLPSYTERSDASLVWMVRQLIRHTKQDAKGFYQNDPELLIADLKKAEENQVQPLLIGVSFALLDLAEHYGGRLSNAIIMETGGMKGQRREMVREELHERLCRGFQCESIASEYGMTEILSQAYARSNGIFHFPPWADVVIRDPYDPLSTIQTGQSGVINIIDLANINSCSFLATKDIGRKREDGSFEVLGRMDNSDIRGCNLLFDA